MSLVTQITSLAQAIGNDVQALYAQDGTLSSLNTTEKSSLVAAINEVNTALGGLTVDHGGLTGLSDDDHPQYSIISTGSVPPSTAPSRAGAIYIDVVAGDVYLATGNSVVGDWIIVSDPSLVINDSATNGDTDVVWSADKVYDEIAAAKTAVTTQILDSAPATLDTLNELAAALGDDPNYATTVSTALANRVRFDAAQTLTSGEQTQARSNIDAASTGSVTAVSDNLSTLTTNVGDTTHNFATDYTMARDS